VHRRHGRGAGGNMRYLRGLMPVSKRININVRLEDPRVTICSPGREIERPPFVVRKIRHSSNSWVRAIRKKPDHVRQISV